MGIVRLMLVYRVFPYLAAAKKGAPGHPLYEHHPQRGGRIDHPDYYVWYVARSPEAACGETFGNQPDWNDDMFAFPGLAGSRRALGTFRLPDDLRVCDLDDARQLVQLGLRPTQVVVRNPAVTQAWGHRIWAMADPGGAGRLWDAVSWWSYHRPSWPIVASWFRPELVDVQALDLDHPAIQEAATALVRPLER